MIYSLQGCDAMGLTINQTYAAIGIDTTPSRLDINTEKARLQLHQKFAKVNIHTELPRVEIDQYEAFASAGLKGNSDLTKEAADRGYQQAMEYINKTSQDGYRLSAIEKGGNPIADIAVRDAYPTHEFGLDFIPKVGPKITVKGKVQFDAEKNSEGVDNGVSGTFIPGSVNINYTPGQVNVYIKQYNSISINYTGTNIDSHI